MPSNTGFQGIDVRQTANQLVFRTFWTKSAGAALETLATVTISIFELQSDGTLKTFEFAAGGNQFTFQSGAVTTAAANMTLQKGNNNTLDTGIRTYSLAILTGFTKGAIYLVQCNDPSADVQWQTREFQFGSAQGDLTLDNHNNLNSNSHDAGGNAITSGAIPAAAAGANGGLPTVDSAGKVPAKMGSSDYAGNTVQTGDPYARIGPTGSGLTSLAPASTALSTAQWTNALANLLSVLAGHDPGGTLATSSALASVSANITACQALLRCDEYIDTGVNPWARVKMQENSGGIGTGTELQRQKLYDVNGAALVSTTVVVGEAHE
ncbi:MAG TPA: hypothetical protein VGX78_16950 [Pirellulales bacterium]|jgi:hypothetical protein|nr:hypothetical protein [Pirellulales bacterium]